MEKLESLEKYVITPNVRFYGGFKYEGKDIELCDDTDKEYIKEEQEDGSIIEKEVASIKVQQRIINSVLITEIEAERKMKNGKKIKEKSHMEIEIEENQLLVYVEGQGFVIPEYKMLKIDEAIERYELLKSPNSIEEE